MKNSKKPFIGLVLIPFFLGAVLEPSQAGTLSVTNGSFTNLTGLVNHGGGWYGGVPAGWSTATTPANAYTVLLSGGTYYANLQQLGGTAPFAPLRQNVGTVDITSDVTLTFTRNTLAGTSSLGSAIYDLALPAYTSHLASYDSGSITGASTVSYTARGVGPGTSLYIAFWNGSSAAAAGISGVSIADSATTYAWNGGVSGTWSSGGGGWTDKFDNTAATYNNAKPVVAQFTNASAGTSVTVAAGGVNVGNIQVSGANYGFSGGTITMTNTTWSVGAGQTANVGSTLAGTTGLTKADAGTLALSASNSYSGGTTVNAGTLALQNANALGSGALTVNGGTLDLGGNNLTAVNLGGTGGAISLGGNTLTASMTSGRQFDGTISGTGGLVKNGASYLTLNGSNSYTGGTTVNGGTMYVTGSGTLGAAGGSVTVSNAVLDLRNQQTRTGTITMIGQEARLVSGTGTGSLVNNGGALQFGGGQITASISGTGGLNVTGGGSLNASNSFTGDVTISGTDGWYGANSLFVDNANGLGAASNNLTMSAGFLSLQNNTIVRSGNLTISGGTVQTGTFSKSGSDYDIQGGNINVVLAGTAGLTKSGTNGAILNAANTYTGGTTITGGTLVANGTLGAASGAVTVNATASANEVTLDLRGTNTRTGTISMSGQNARLVGGAGTASLVNNGSAFQFGGGLITNVAISGTGGLHVTGGGSISASNSYTGATTISNTAGWYGTHTLYVDNANALGAASGALTIAGGTVSLNSNTITRSGDLTISAGYVHTGTLSKSGSDYDVQGGTIGTVLAGTAGLTKAGTNTAVLGAANIYSGATTVNGGTLQVASGGSISSSSTTVNSGGTLDVDGTAGAVMINNGGTLKGDGTVSALTIASGGTLAVGNSPGQMNVTGNAEWAGGGIYSWEFASAAGNNSDPLSGQGVNWDFLNVAGELNITANSSSQFIIDVVSLLALNDTSFNLNDNYSFTIATAAGGITSFLASDFNITGYQATSSNNRWSIGRVTNSGGISQSLVLSYSGATAIPEPSSAALALIGLGVLAWRRRFSVR